MSPAIQKTPERKQVDLEEMGMVPKMVSSDMKGKYGTLVTNQVRMTALSYQGYYAKNSSLFGKVGEKDKILLALLGMHKAGKRAVKALEEKGANWRTSGALRKDDKTFIAAAEKHLAELEKAGMSLSNPEGMLTKMGEFGKIGEGVIENAEQMPIFGEARAVEDLGNLQKGDRVIDFGDGVMRTLRGGDVAETAMLYMLTFMTCQGVSVEKFKEIANKEGDNAFSDKSDRKFLLKQGMSKSKIDALEKNGMLAKGLAMFTEHRFNEMPGHFSIHANLTCGLSVFATPNTFVEGEAPEKLDVGGNLSITRSDVSVNKEEGQTITVSVMKGMESPAGEVYKKVYSTNVTADAEGNYCIDIPKSYLGTLKSGDYLITAGYEGEVLGENLACETQVGLTVEKKAPVKKEQPEKKPKKKRGVEIALNIAMPRIDRYTYSRTSRFGRRFTNEEIREGDFTHGVHKFSKFLAREKITSQVSEFEVPIPISQLKGKFRARGTVSIAYHKMNIVALSDRHMPLVTRSMTTKVGAGGQVLYSPVNTANARITGAVGLFFKRIDEDPTLLRGLEADFGNPTTWGRIGARLGNNIGEALRRAAIHPDKGLFPSKSALESYGVWYERQVRNISVGLEVTDPSNEYRNLSLRIGYVFPEKSK
ncbi:MAG: hypothetical protein ABIG39_04705 [Candidatus Micrarchaeota archaeon]